MRKMLWVIAGVIGSWMLLSGGGEVRAGNPCAVPASWGRLVAVTEVPPWTMLAFEASDGTIRTIPTGCKMPPRPVDVILRSPD